MPRGAIRKVHVSFGRSWTVKAQRGSVDVASPRAVLDAADDHRGGSPGAHLQFAQPGGSITIMGSPEDLARNLVLIKCYHDKMFKKYEYLAWHPWTSADPDPPPGFNLIID